MLRVLNDEDGFDIKARELVRVRARNRWLLRAANGDKAKGVDRDDGGGSGGPGDDDDHVSPDGASTAERSSQRTMSDGNHSDRQGGAADNRKRRKRKQAGASGGAPLRFPSETTLDEARKMMGLDPATYQLLRTNFQRICQEEGVTKKTLAGMERWEAVKARLVRETPQLQTILWLSKDEPEPKGLALDVICTDVTKRLRNLETRMTLVEAKKELGINPEEAREVRVAFHHVLSESKITCKSEASPEQWEDLKRKWSERSDLVRKITEAAGGGPESSKLMRALDVIARDVMKRIRDERGRQDPRASQQLPLSPAASHGGKMLSPADRVELGDGLAGAFDNVSEVSHTSQQMAFSPASSTMGSTMGGHMPISLQSQASNLSDSQDGLGPPQRVLGPTMAAAAGMGLEPQIGPSLLLRANTQAAFMDQPFVQQQYPPAATSAPVYAPDPGVSMACAVYLRLHPMSAYLGGTSLWIATLGSGSVEELRQVAAAKFPGTVCLRVEGILKDSKGRELPLQIEEDQELSAYLAHLEGAAPTFSVQLVWKT
ncbi:hypothetical protein JDV02_009239 [Purpureocillium takamizusanense]|nr:uncharacterized protein JDV02_009239 [Purpureocillium takamizusanense]UNI23421.1 hypothetical protein JDV02_009239 [Purpureocillium takamizusanense]